MSALVVDDDEGTVAVISRMLRAQGMSRVYAETDPRRMTYHFVEHRPDIVLLDLHMPNSDGFEVLAQIRQLSAGTYLPVLVLTADVDPAVRHRALKEGAQDFLIKPLDLLETTLRVANLLQTRRLYTTLRRTAGADDIAPLDERGQTLERIRNVLRDKAISPVFQPVVDLVTLETIGHEGLSRFSEPGRGGPDKWFAEAFSVGLGVELEWLAANSMLSYFDTAAPDMFLAINMSPATIMQLADQPLCSVDIWHRLVIELTEHVPVEDYPALQSALAEMRSHGTRLSADDVGAGYAGFRHLIRLKPDIIKLDIGLVAGIDHHHEQRALVRALVAFAHEIGADLVAEGIEEPGELAVLRELNVAHGQGFLVGPPAAIARRSEP